MSIETLFSSNIIVPIIVAFIGFLVAVTTAVIAKEQKVSEFRQKWVDDIRSDLAIALQNSYDCLYELQNPSTEESVKKYNISYRELEFRCNLIILKLNPKKDEVFIELIRKLLKDLFVVSQDTTKLNIQSCQQTAAQFQKMSHGLLKKEWERVKKGEKHFLIFRNFGELCLFAFVTAFLIMLAVSKFPEYFLTT
ncbi:hypothetical protein [Shewanella frigidimarina]|uniref:hypothetical protein n=1 Tax=Shewanella frigidimarina TaxID=56812 RepID=UPI003FA0BAC4